MINQHSTQSPSTLTTMRRSRSIPHPEGYPSRQNQNADRNQTQYLESESSLEAWFPGDSRIFVVGDTSRGESYPRVTSRVEYQRRRAPEPERRRTPPPQPKYSNKLIKPHKSHNPNSQTFGFDGITSRPIQPQPSYIRPSVDYRTALWENSEYARQRKAVCIGINYIGHPKIKKLDGCINDAQRVRKFLIEGYGYKPENVALLTDDKRSPTRPTRANILKAINWLVHDASPRDRLFFHFSGHSRQVADVDGDERDGQDEAIVPVDGGHILDDELHKHMVKPLPEGCRLTAIFDTCYSGSTLDLPYVHCSDGTRGKPIPVTDKIPVQNYPPFYSSGAASSDSTSRAREPHPVWESRFSNARVVYFGACKDKEQSQEGNDQNGALTDAFLLSMEKNPNQTYLELLRSIRVHNRRRLLKQKAQLATCWPMDHNDIVVI